MIASELLSDWRQIQIGGYIKSNKKYTYNEQSSPSKVGRTVKLYEFEIASILITFFLQKNIRLF
jgi:hypothetical protein